MVSDTCKRTSRCKSLTSLGTVSTCCGRPGPPATRGVPITIGLGLNGGGATLGVEACRSVQGCFDPAVDAELLIPAFHSASRDTVAEWQVDWVGPIPHEDACAIPGMAAVEPPAFIPPQELCAACTATCCGVQHITELGRACGMQGVACAPNDWRVAAETKGPCGAE